LDDQQQGPWLHLLMTLISLAGMAAIVWLEMPPSERMMVSLTCRSVIQRTAHRAARRAGRAGMGAELHEHMPTAHASYGVAYRLAQLRDRL